MSTHRGPTVLTTARKAVVSALVAGLGVLGTTLEGGLTGTELAGAGITAALAGLGVYQVSNAPAA